MKKFGFTLAEVLITLGIIGVVAAITLPTLNSNTTMASIGPKLGKAVSVFEQANQALLTNMSVDGLTDSGLLADGLGDYVAALGNNMKINDVGIHAIDETGAGGTCVLRVNYGGGVAFQSKDGLYYNINLIANPAVQGIAPHRAQIGTAYVDINGAADPNEVGTDVFAFAWMNDGSLNPVGLDAGQCDWAATCPLADDGEPTDLWGCAGHVFANNMRADWE